MVFKDFEDGSGFYCCNLLYSIYWCFIYIYININIWYSGNIEPRVLNVREVYWIQIMTLLLGIGTLTLVGKRPDGEALMVIILVQSFFLGPFKKN